jgi:hypothetical protein
LFSTVYTDSGSAQAPVTTLCCFPNRSIVCFLLET